MDNSNKINKFLPENNRKNKYKEEPIYIMTIELEQGKNGNLPIYLNSNPEELSFNFCKQNNLDYNSMDFLKNQIIKFKNDFLNNDKNLLTPTIEEEIDEESTRQNNINNNNNIINDNSNNSYILKNNENINSNENKAFNHNLLSKNAIYPNKIIRKNPVILKNKNKKSIRKFLIPKQHLKTELPIKKSNQTFISLNKQKINPNEHTLFSYERFFNIIKEKGEKKHSRNNKSFSNKISKENLNRNNNHSFNLINNTSQKNIRTYSNNNYNYYNFIEKKKSEKEKEKEKENDLNEKNLIKKSSKEIKKKIYKNIQKNSFTNTGERLYEKGIKLIELENKRIKELKENLLKNSFQPKINSNTSEILEESKKNRINYKDDKSLLHYNEIIEKKMKKLKDKYKEEKYSFFPNFNIKSLKMEKKKNLTKKERLNIMYNSKEKTNKKLKQIENEMYENCTFKPEILENNLKGNLMNKSFEERQKIFLSKSQEKKNKLFLEMNENIDTKTGQEYFIPLINEIKNETFYLTRNNNVFDYLYSYAEKYKLHKSYTQKYLLNIEKNQRNLSIHDSSNKIYDFKKYKTFEKIFDLFNKENNNTITFEKMDFSKIPNKVIKALNPIIEEIKNSDYPILKEDFIEGCFKLYDILSFYDKQNIMRFPENEKKNKKIKELIPNFPFKPTIDKNSEKISNYNFILNTSNYKSNEEFKESDSSYINFLKQNMSYNSLS